MFFTRAAFFLSLLATAASAAETGTGLPKNSPFIPVGTPGTAVVAANENIEFAGVSSMGKKTDLILYDKSTKKSHWIGVGETKEGIAVLNYDSRREQAVVKVNGTEKILALRKGSGPVNSAGGVAPMPVGFNVAPMPVLTPAVAMPLPQPVANVPPDPAMNPGSQPAKPPGPSVPETQAKQETEARMLVSDLLEIGMAQRKAYEEAQRKAASGPAQSGDAQNQPAPGAPTQPGKPDGN